MILSGGILPLLVSMAAALPQQTQTQAAAEDRAPVVRRVAATAQLAAQEYRVGVVNGRVVAKSEVEEAAMFLQEARRSAALLPSDSVRTAIAQIDSLIQLVKRTSPPDTLDARVRVLAGGLSQRFGVSLDELPAETPSLARGAEVYQANCAGCHGSIGRGDGPQSAGLEPPPANLADHAALHDVSPLDYYRRISFGTVGTAMPAFEARLPPEDRWAAALYASVLRLPAPAGEVPPAVRTFATTGRMSDDQLVAALGLHDAAEPGALARVAAVRTFQSDASAAATAQVFDRVRAQIDSTYTLARAGSPAATARAVDAYMTFEQVERTVRAKDPALAAELEASFATLRTRAAGGATPAELSAIRSRLAVSLEKAERTIGNDLSPVNLFFQSLIILLREGLEAILIVGALMTFLTKMGAGHRKRDINIGVGAAIGASLLTALALETIFVLSPAKREALEGGTMIVATAVLFYVSYWLLSKMEVVKWNRFVKSKVQDALSSGSALALASAAFLAVYREGFETVLFYKALFLSGSGGGAMPVVGGILVGSVVLLAIYVAIHRFGVRIPLKPFFAVTSAFLYYMAFVFAGKGVAELQEGDLVPSTFASWAPRLPALGIYPTAESLALQGALLLLLLVALAWNFVIEPRRARRLGRAMVQEKKGANHDLLRSLERMEADLAEMRAEVERMRRNIASSAPNATSAKPPR
jgi:high-affinity iron transporter